MNRRVDSYLPGAAAIVAVMLGLLLLPWLGETLFYSKGEPREAIVGLSIIESGDWILPVNYGSDIPFKPPFLGWLIAIFAYIFNGGEVNEYISRLPSALAAIAMVMGGYVWARRERGVRFAVIFSFVTIGSFEVFRAALACRLDMVLTACMVGAIYLMYYIREHRPRSKRWLYVAVWALLTCATLTKGPVGALLPCFVIGVYRLLRGDRFWPTLAKMLGLSALALVLPAWWFYEAWQRGGDHFYDLMMEENIGRLTGNMSYGSHTNPIWYNFITLIAGLLPWTIFLLASCFSARKFRREPLKPAGLLSLCAAVLVVGFYCIPESKRSVYLLPAYPFICYGITSLLDNTRAIKPVKFFAWFMAILAVIAPLAIVALQIFPQPWLQLSPIPWWGYILLVIPLGAGVAWIINRHSPIGHTCVTVWALYLAYVAVGMPAVLNPKSDLKAVERLSADPEAAIYTLDTYRLYSLNFYLHDRIRPISSLEEAATCPAGTMVLIHATADTTGLTENFTYEHLLDRSADHRRPIGLAIKKDTPTENIQLKNIQK